MKTVGIRELKARLSSYINEIRTVRKIIVTDHGEEVAVISPLSDEYRTIQFLSRNGKLQWSKEKPLGLECGITPRGELFSDTILEERK